MESELLKKKEQNLSKAKQISKDTFFAQGEEYIREAWSRIKHGACKLFQENFFFRTFVLFLPIFLFWLKCWMLFDIYSEFVEFSYRMSNHSQFVYSENVIFGFNLKQIESDIQPLNYYGPFDESFPGIKVNSTQNKVLKQLVSENMLVEEIDYDIKFHFCLPVPSLFQYRKRSNTTCAKVYSIQQKSTLLAGQKGREGQECMTCLNNQGSCGKKAHKCPIFYVPEEGEVSRRVNMCRCQLKPLDYFFKNE